ncbi:MAG: hypothetical protein BWX80_03882 [Candidatus Hydrogenedentes bacterium ADurb.Bin101]|nr:MAG: hypothetical protein BWX80_03882 [Candidatus Hydrogenedentes bacterium ADurb.Bin101]
MVPLDGIAPLHDAAHRFPEFFRPARRVIRHRARIGALVGDVPEGAPFRLPAFELFQKTRVQFESLSHNEHDDLSLSDIFTVTP